MVKHEHAHKPNKLINKIHKQLKRQYALYEPSKISYNFITTQREKSHGRWRKASKKTIDESIDQVAKHLWYPHLNMSVDELRSLVVQEYQTVQLLELIEDGT